MNIQGFYLVTTAYEMLFECLLGFSGRNVCIYVYVLFVTAGKIVMAASGSPDILTGICSASRSRIFQTNISFAHCASSGATRRATIQNSGCGSDAVMPSRVAAQQDK